MADFTALKTAIQTAIKQNGNEEITGAILQEILLSIVNTMGDGAINSLTSALSTETTNRQNADGRLQSNINSEALARQNADSGLQTAINSINTRLAEGYVYVGIATAATNPGTPAGKVFYIALQTGTYTNFSGLTVTQGITILKYNGTAWSQDQLVGIDDVPTKESNKLVKSGGVFANIGAFDISEYHKSGSTLATYADLTAALAALPSDYQKGGMSVKFVCTSDNKYVSYRLMADSWSINTDEWAIAEESVYVENPEFVYVKTDREGKILWAIKTDGTKLFGAGIEVNSNANIGGNINVGGNANITGDLSFNGADVTVIENPEFTGVWLDKDEHILFGIQSDGNFLFGCGVPQQIVDFVNSIKTELVYTIGTKVDKEEGKGLIPIQYIEEIDNPEFIQAKLDSEGKVLEGTKKDGTKVIGSNLEVKGTINGVNIKEGKSLINSEYSDGVSYTENPEFIDVELDGNDKILGGRKTDGTKFESVAFEVGGHITKNIEDPEGRKEITLDSKQKILSYRKKDGTKVETVGLETPEIKAERLQLSDDGFDAFIQDLNNKEYAPNNLAYKPPYLPQYGVINVKTETFYLTANPNVSTIDDVVLIYDFPDTAANAADRMTIAHYYVKDATIIDNGDGTYSATENSIRLQHYGYGRVSLNAEDNKFYAKDPIRKVNGVCYYADSLGFQSEQYWVGSQRTKVIDGYTRIAPDDPSLAEGAVKQSYVEVVEITGPACIDAWTVADWDFNASLGSGIGKKYEHRCISKIDFGGYFANNNVAITLKHQGNSTMGIRKRNLRITPYKKSDYAKKNKIKIGEMLRLSKFNLKSNFVDNSRIKETILYRIFKEIWDNRPITDRYNWDYGINGLYHGVSGNIQGFPIRLNVAGEFYGIYSFNLPKDGNNYLIDDKDENTGMLLCGNGNNWGVNLPYSIPSNYDSEMDSDDLNDYPGIISAMTEWTHFINNRLYKGSDNNTYNITELTEVDGIMYVTSTLVDGQVVGGSVSAELIEFNRENATDRLDVLGFMDYLICLQVFLMDDNMHHNMMFYSDGEKKKIFPFFYDMDNAIRIAKGYDFDLFDEETAASEGYTFWNSFKDIYWDDIVNRYCALRKGILSIEFIRKVYDYLKTSIPDSEYVNENRKWGTSSSASNFDEQMEFLTKRISYLDNNYFNV